MPRPKKTTPTVATTEPDTNMNPDRAQVAAVADLPHVPDEAQVPTSVPAMPEAMDDLRATIAEQSARIAELEAWQADAREKNIIAWRHLGSIRQAIADAGCVPATPIVTGTEIDWASMESEEGDGATLRLVREVLAKVPRTAHDHAAGYLAITSGNVRAARWKRNILHDIRDPDMVIGQIDHLTDGWAPSVKGAAAPPMKTEAEARAWCEARCGWTVVQ